MFAPAEALHPFSTLRQACSPEVFGNVELLQEVSPWSSWCPGPLTDALKGPGKSLVWSPALVSAFLHAKDLFASVPELVHPLPGTQISLAVDASDSQMGSVLQQLLYGTWDPLAFFSKKLSEADHKYSAFDRKLLIAYSSLRHFRFLLEGRECTMFTDHKTC